MDMRAMLDKVTALKRERGISSASAFSFLKRQEACRKLWTEFSSAFPDEKLSPREFANLLDAISREIFQHLNLCEINLAEFGFQAGESLHLVRMFQESPEEFEEEVRGAVPLADDEHQFIGWELDYAAAVRILGRHARNRAVSIRTMVSDLSGLAEAFMRSPEKFIAPAGTVAFASWKETAEAIVARNKKDRAAGKIYLIIVPEEIEGIPPEEAEKFLIRRNEEEQDTPGFHPYETKAELLENWREDREHELEGTSNLSRHTADEWEYLVHDKLGEHSPLKRSEIEHTRGDLRVERRIAAQGFLHCWEDLSEDCEFDEIYEAALSHARKSIQDSEAGQRKLIALNAPQRILNTALETIRNRKYVLLCMKKNKRWLEEFFAE